MHRRVRSTSSTGFQARCALVRAIQVALACCALTGSIARGQSAPTPAGSASTQPSSEPTTQPASQPASQPENPLRSAAKSVAYFDQAMADGRVADALACLSFAQVDPEVARAEGADYATKLAEILARMTAAGLFDRSKLSDDPTAGPQPIGRDPLVVLLDRFEVQVEGQIQFRWQFAASSVASIPELHQQLDMLATLSKSESPKPAPEPAPRAARGEAPAPSPFRSPYHLVEHFLVKSIAAKDDPKNYVDAMACLDFALLEPSVVEADGPDFVDQLAAVLARLRTDKLFDREKDLPRQPDSAVNSITIGKDPFALIIARQSDGTWRFAASTVQRLPQMFATLSKPAEPGAAPGAAQTPAPAPAAELTIPLDNSSPRATMNLYLAAMNRNDLASATRCFDLSRLSDAERSIAPARVGKVWLVLNRHKLIVMTDLPADPESRVPYTVLNHTAGRIEIARQRGGPRDGEWLFNAATLATVDTLFDAYESKPVLPELRDRRVSFLSLPGLYVREYLAPNALKTPLLGLYAWQWAGIGLAAGFAATLRWLSTILLVAAGRRLLRSEDMTVLPSVVRRALRPTANLAMLVALWGGARLLDLGAAIESWTWRILTVLLAVAGVHAFYRLIDLLVSHANLSATRGRPRADEVLVSLISRTFKVLVFALGFIVIARSVGFDIGVLLAGVGLGGLAFGLAAQDTLKNFFGLVNVVLDRPFAVGDWIKIGDVEGTVESVGLRSARLRTLHNSELTIPNSDLMTSRIDNMGRRVYRRFMTNLSVTYSTTPEQLDAMCEGVRELLRRHPYTRKDFYAVHVWELAASSIQILVVAFFETPDWPTEARERHRLVMDIIRLAERLRVEWAFPTQTVHIQRTAGAPGGTASPVPIDPTESQLFGRDEAAAIVRKYLGDGVEKPPPVAF